MKNRRAKRIGFLLAMVLALTGAFAAAAEEMDFSAYKFFRSMEGRISYTLPDKPSMVGYDADLEGVFKDSTILAGTLEDGGEYMIHIADLSPFVQRTIEQYQDDTEDVNMGPSAMLTYANAYIVMYDGKIEQYEPIEFDGEAANICGVSFTYEYGDTPGVPYSGKGLMDGMRTVVLMGTSGDSFDALAAELQPATQAEVSAFAARQPDTLRLGELTVTFPTPAYGFEQEQGVQYLAYGDQFTYCNVQRIPIGLDISAAAEDEETLNSIMEEHAKEMMQQDVGTETLDEYTVDTLSPTAFCVSGKCTAPGSYGIYNPTYLFRAYISLGGLYYVLADDTDVGAEFMQSITFSPVEEAPLVSVNGE